MDTEKSYLEDELELEVPKNGLKTMKRMWDSAPEQHLRLLLVMISVVCYTLFSIVSPLYSAHLVDLIWNGVKESAAQGTVFSSPGLGPGGGSCSSCFSSILSPGCSIRPRIS